jgi:hypothetical protein
MNKNYSILFCALLAISPLTAADQDDQTTGPVRFSAMGDVPYSASDFNKLRSDIQFHNQNSHSEFMVHLGDIHQNQPSLCTDAFDASVANELLALSIPTYIIPGDNEWTDCGNSTAINNAWTYWMNHFNAFEKNWSGAFVTERQVVRPENFAFVRKGVLFIGINLVGGHPPTGPSQSVWDTYVVPAMNDDANWVEEQFAQHKEHVRAAVIFSQASDLQGNGTVGTYHKPFIDRFRLAAKTFEKPILFLQGDYHTWRVERPWPEQNILRVVVDEGHDAPPVEVVVTMDEENMFTFDRQPFNNRAPVALFQRVTFADRPSIPIQICGDDADGDTLAYRIVDSPLLGQLSGTPPELQYTPNELLSLQDRFAFIVNDGKTDSAVQTVEIDATYAINNDQPSASAPVPFNPVFNMLTSQELTIPIHDNNASEVHIYTMNGEKLRTLSRPSTQPSITWDGRDDNQHSVPAGLYYLRAGSQRKKIVVLK